METIFQRIAEDLSARPEQVTSAVDAVKLLDGGYAYFVQR